jgi:hypothetical protein
VLPLSLGLKLSSTLKMEAADSSETSVNIYQNRGLHVPENSFQVPEIKSVRSVKVNVRLDNNNTPE